MKRERRRKNEKGQKHYLDESQFFTPCEIWLGIDQERFNLLFEKSDALVHQLRLRLGIFGAYDLEHERVDFGKVGLDEEGHAVS